MIPRSFGVSSRALGHVSVFDRDDSKEHDEVVGGQRCLPEHRSQSPRGEFAVEWDDRSQPVSVAELHVTSALADLLEPNFAESGDDSAPETTGSRGLTQRSRPRR